MSLTDDRVAPRRDAELRPTGVVGLVVLAALLVGALLAPWLAPFDPGDQDVARRLTPPFRHGSPFLLGTDHVGRDVLAPRLRGADRVADRRLRGALLKGPSA